MILATILTSIACLFILAGLFTTTITRKSKFGYRIKKRSLYRRLHSLEQIQKIKEYAELFSIDSSAKDIDTHEILLLGNKLEEDFGSDKFTEMVHQVHEERSMQRRTVLRKMRSNVSHAVSSLIRKLNLIINYTNVFNTLFIGGNDRGEDGSVIS